MNNVVKRVLSSFWVIVFTYIINAQNPYSTLYEQNYKEKLKEYENNVKVLMEVDRSPGLAVAFVKGNFIWSKGFGKIDVENEVEINSESLFNNKTLLRLMITASILQLHEDGKINLSNSLQSYLKNTNISQKSLSIKQILTLLGPTIFTSFNRKSGFKSQIDFDLSQTELDNLYIRLISLVEFTSSQKFRDYLKEKIWNPLLMFSTRLEDKQSIMKNRVKSYYMNKGKINNFIEDQSIENGETLQIRTTVNDMIKFAYGFISNKYFKKIKYENLFLSVDYENKDNAINLGWTFKPVNGQLGIGFFNDKNDDNSILVVFPKDTFAITIASNLKNADLFPYMKRLFHLIMGESYELKPYLDSSSKKLIFNLIDNVFNSGLSNYYTYSKKFTKSDLNFEYLNNRFSIIEKNTSKPSDNDSGEKELLKNLGCFIASSLANEHGIESLQKYHQRGAIDFFNDYIKMYNNKNNWPSHLKLSSSAEKTIDNWTQEWKFTLNDFTSDFYIDPGKNNRIKLNKLKELYKGKNIVPNFCYDFSLATEQFSKLNKIENAQGTGMQGIEIFNTCPEIYHALGISFAWFKDPEVTQEMFRRAQEFTHPNYSRPDHFIQIAKYFKNWGKTKEAIAMLEEALRLDGNSVKLYSYIGDLYLEINQITKAKRYYNKAIKIDPEYDYAKMKINMLNDRNKN